MEASENRNKNQETGEPGAPPRQYIKQKGKSPGQMLLMDCKELENRPRSSEPFGYFLISDFPILTP